MNDPGITGVHNLWLSFGAREVFRNLNVEVMPGEKVCLSGPSGSGKTTFLNLLMGFQTPDKGGVWTLGEEVDKTSIRRLRTNIAWLPQEISLDAETGRDLLLAPLRFKTNRHLLPDENQVRRILDDLILEPELLDQQSDTLSGGQKQRIALASCLLLQRPLLLLDEPTAALDDDSANAVASLVMALKDVTLISVSHDERWLRQMDRVIPLNNNSH